MPIDITKRLLRLDPHQAELQNLLCTMGDSQMRGNVVEYGGWIRAHFSKDGTKIEKAEWIHDPGIGMFDKLEMDFRDALTRDAGVAVGTRYLFTNKPLVGVTKVADAFQLLPLPPEAPRPPVTCAKWPCLLEFAFPDSPNPHTRMFRRENAARSISAFLQIAAGPNLWVDNPTDHLWVWSNRPLLERAGSEWRQAGYHAYEAWPDKDKDGFSIADRLPAPESDIGYFMPPHDLAARWKAFTSMRLDDREKFLRAAHLYETAHRLWPGSFTMAFAALIIAAETIMPTPSGEPCPTCRRPKQPGMNSRYRQHLASYCPGLPDELIEDFAKRRHKYLHGGSLMLLDQRRAHSFLPGEQQEQDVITGMYNVCQVALLNWMTTRGGCGPQQRT